MFKLTDEQAPEFAAAVAAVPTEATAAMHAIYAAFEQERAIRAPRCDQSGACCRFEEHGHRLFVTTIEVAAFGLEGFSPIADWDGLGCPHQIAGLCAAHTARPFGCRVYFCDQSSDDWQHAQYERSHALIRELHERYGVAYWYVEWREALAASGLARPAVPRAADGHVATRRVSLTVRSDRR